MPAATIFHNPACGTSRSTLALMREASVEPRVVEYLETPPSRADLDALVAALGGPVRDILRRKEALYAELGLDEPRWSDAELLDALQRHPVLLNRPIVLTPLGARVCRPAETVREILPARA